MYSIDDGGCAIFYLGDFALSVCLRLISSDHTISTDFEYQIVSDIRKIQSDFVALLVDGYIRSPVDIKWESLLFGPLVSEGKYVFTLARQYPLDVGNATSKQGIDLCNAAQTQGDIDTCRIEFAHSKG